MADWTPPPEAPEAPWRSFAFHAWSRQPTGTRALLESRRRPSTNPSRWSQRARPSRAGTVVSLERPQVPHGVTACFYFVAGLDEGRTAFPAASPVALGEDFGHPRWVDLQ